MIEILTGKLRAEMKSRVDEILKSGDEWNKTAKELTEALNKLVEAIQKGNFDPSIPKSVARSTRKLAKETIKLTMAFEAYKDFLKKVLTRYG